MFSGEWQGEKRLKASHAAFGVGHFSPCGEWDVPVEFAIDWFEKKGIKTLSGWKCNKRTTFMM